MYEQAEGRYAFPPIRSLVHAEMYFEFIESPLIVLWAHNGLDQLDPGHYAPKDNCRELKSAEKYAMVYHEVVYVLDKAQWRDH